MCGLYLSMDTTENIQSIITPDLAELGELCGCTEKQVAFAAALLEGNNYTEAAFHAGYAGARDSVQLRSAGSSAARSKPVQALLALAESRGLGIPNAPGDWDELKRILWSHARSKDKAHSIKASSELIRLEDEEKAAKADEPGDPLALLKEMSGPIAAYLAQEHNLDFQLSEEQQAAYQNYRRKIAIEYLDEQRAKAHISPGAKSNGHTGGTS